MTECDVGQASRRPGVVISRARAVSALPPRGCGYWERATVCDHGDGLQAVIAERG
ncbi:MAG TPA: hypothetical protein VEC76_03225 [Streptosporangiaceae bacterium]|nr:hypothetical protein [Streptosporangiaceae bacterium]